MSEPRSVGWHLASHLFLILLFTGFCAWYLHDAWRASASLFNLVLILPASIVGIALGLGILVRTLVDAWRASPSPPARADAEAAAIPDDDDDAEDPAQARRPLYIMALVVAYVAAMPVIGLSLSTFLFMVASLAVLGLRNPVALVLFPVAVTAALAGMTAALLTLPVPMISILGLR